MCYNPPEMTQNMSKIRGTPHIASLAQHTADALRLVSSSTSFPVYPFSKIGKEEE